MHPLLEKQFKKTIKPKGQLLPEWQDLLALISESYEQFEDECSLLRKSLNMTSADLLKLHIQLKQQSQSNDPFDKLVQLAKAMVDQATFCKKQLSHESK